jgi:hypothetical protein
VQHGLDVSELQKLTALTRLRMHCARSSIEACVGSLVAVTQLQSLALLTSAKVAAVSMLPLMALTALTQLCVAWANSGGGDVEGDGGLPHFIARVRGDLYW